MIWKLSYKPHRCCMEAENKTDKMMFEPVIVARVIAKVSLIVAIFLPRKN